MNYIAIAEQNVADNYPLIIYAKPQISELPKGAIIGTWAYSVPGKVRYILDKTREVSKGVMPGDLTRAWIRDAYKLPIRLRKSQINSKHYQLPLVSMRGAHGLCSYVDIKAAYLHILSLGYDVEYEHGLYLGSNRIVVPEQIAANKMSYAMAVAMSNSQRSSVSIKGDNGIFETNSFNIYSNPCLYAIACDVLASVASEIIRVLGENVKYVNTDGYIVASGKEQTVIDICNSWGFNARVKHEGETFVHGAASWQVGQARTSRYNPNANDYMSPLPDKNQSLWLKRNFTRLHKCAIMT